MTTTISLSSPVTIPAAKPADARVGVHGGPRVILRVEGALVLALAVAVYRHLGGEWGAFAALFLLPDLTMLGYLAGPRAGAVLYNVGHSLIGPALLGAAALTIGAPSWVLVALVWLAHIGFDRMMGYGLKHATAFGHTHLGAIRRAR